jgi:hypothetical protein
MRQTGVTLAVMLFVAMSGAAEPPKPTTIDHPQIAIADLDLLARPLTKAQLLVEAEGWLGLLQAKVTEISQAEIAIGRAADDEAKARLREAVTQLRTERTQLIERLNVVLAALKAKGGAAADYDAYISAVSGIDIKATDTPDPKVPKPDLELLVRPMTKAQLIIEADRWLAALQQKAKQVSAAEIQASKSDGAEAKAKLLNEAGAWREERAQITDRLNLVLAALKTKGGTTADYETYINAVSGITVNVTDAHATWTAVINWLKSTEGGLRYGKNILLFLVTMIVFQVLGRAIGGVTRRALNAFKNTSSLLRDFTVNTVRKITLFVGFVVALSMLEVNIGPFLAAMGAVGFIVGFALQGTLSNFAAGIMILLYRPYDLGDKVTVAGTTGVVKAMTLVSTVLHNADQHVITIPNSSIWGGTISNLSAGTVTVPPAPTA